MAKRAARKSRSFALIADRFLEQREIDQVDLPAAELHGALPLEVDEHPIHGHACRADEGGEVLLRQLDDVRRPHKLVLVEQQLRDAPMKVEEDQILDVSGAESDAPREQ